MKALRALDDQKVEDFLLVFPSFLQGEVVNLTPNPKPGWPNKHDKSQIDHLLINGKWRRSLRDVRVRRGADVGSDHHLVTAMVQLKLLRSRRTTGHRGRFDGSKLKEEETRKQFCTELR